MLYPKNSTNYLYFKSTQFALTGKALLERTTAANLKIANALIVQ
jgi:hypothetical protein